MPVTTTVDLTNPIFTDLDKAREHFEAIRWPNGPYCPFCGGFDRVAALGGKSMGSGWYHCKDCRRKFTAAVGTIYERSHIPMTKWLLATHLMCASKKGMSAHQLHRMIGLPYKTAWFMAHRIREGMRELSPTPTGGAGKTVEADETFIGGKEKEPSQEQAVQEPCWRQLGQGDGFLPGGTQGPGPVYSHPKRNRRYPAASTG
jgi:transposase-like protein